MDSENEATQRQSKISASMSFDEDNEFAVDEPIVDGVAVAAAKPASDGAAPQPVQAAPQKMIEVTAPPEGQDPEVSMCWCCLTTPVTQRV